jgi:hypothetical protein
LKLLLDTCVLYPTVMREMLIGAARAGAYQPLWSERIFGEWQHTAEKLGAGGGVFAAGEMALLDAQFPKAKIAVNDDQLARFWLPDSGDIHVLAAASLGGADGIVTLNNKDFPVDILAEEGLARVNPDDYLLGLHRAQPELIEHVGRTVLAEAIRLSGQDWTIRSLMKKARLPRIGKALSVLPEFDIKAGS